LNGETVGATREQFLQFRVVDVPRGRGDPDLRIGGRHVGRAAETIPRTAQELPQITVIGNTTPLGGLGLPLKPDPRRMCRPPTGKDMQRQQTLDLADYLNNNFSGVNVSESADNPFQTR